MKKENRFGKPPITKIHQIRVCWDTEIANRDNHLIYTVPDNRILNVKFFQVISPAIPNDFDLKIDNITNPIDTSNMMSYELWDENKIVLPPERAMDPSFTGKTRGISHETTDGGTSEGIMSKNSPFMTEKMIKQNIRFTDSVYIKFPNFLSTDNVIYAPIPVRVILIGTLQITYIQEKTELADTYVVGPKGEKLNKPVKRK